MAVICLLFLFPVFYLLNCKMLSLSSLLINFTLKNIYRGTYIEGGMNIIQTILMALFDTHQMRLTNGII